MIGRNERERKRVKRALDSALSVNVGASFFPVLSLQFLFKTSFFGFCWIGESYCSELIHFQLILSLLRAAGIAYNDGGQTPRQIIDCKWSDLFSKGLTMETKTIEGEKRKDLNLEAHCVVKVRRMCAPVPNCFLLLGARLETWALFQNPVNCLAA